MTWTRAQHADLGAALAARGMADLWDEYAGVAGYTWTSPTGGVVYAILDPSGSIEVPLAGADVVVSTVDEAEAVLAEFVRGEMGGSW